MIKVARLTDKKVLLITGGVKSWKGMVTKIEQIDKALFNPVWQQVRTPAPWEAEDPLLATA